MNGKWTRFWRNVISFVGPALLILGAVALTVVTAGTAGAAIAAGIAVSLATAGTTGLVASVGFYALTGDTILQAAFGQDFTIASIGITPDTILTDQISLFDIDFINTKEIEETEDTQSETVQGNLIGYSIPNDITNKVSFLGRDDDFKSLLEREYNNLYTMYFVDIDKMAEIAVENLDLDYYSASGYKTQVRQKLISGNLNREEEFRALLKQIYLLDFLNGTGIENRQQIVNNVMRDVNNFWNKYTEPIYESIPANQVKVNIYNYDTSTTIGAKLANGEDAYTVIFSNLGTVENLDSHVSTFFGMIWSHLSSSEKRAILNAMVNTEIRDDIDELDDAIKNALKNHQFTMTGGAIDTTGIYSSESNSRAFHALRDSYMTYSGRQEYRDVATAQSEDKTKIVTVLHTVVGQVYRTVRDICALALLIVIIYIFIRRIMAISPRERNDFTQTIMNCFVGLCLIFTMHFIISISVNFTKYVTKNILGVTGSNTEEEARANPDGLSYLIESEHLRNAIEEAGNDPNSDITSVVVADPDSTNGVYIITRNFLEAARFKLQEINTVDPTTKVSVSEKWNAIGWSFVYIILVILTISFIWLYGKRVLFMAALTMFAPIVGVMYPLNKMRGEARAHSLNTWLRQYMGNLVMQPLHLFVYTILIGSAMGIALANPLYVIIALMGMLYVEKLLKTIIGIPEDTMGGLSSALRDTTSAIKQGTNLARSAVRTTNRVAGRVAEAGIGAIEAGREKALRKNKPDEIQLPPDNTLPQAQLPEKTESTPILGSADLMDIDSPIDLDDYEATKDQYKKPEQLNGFGGIDDAIDSPIDEEELNRIYGSNNDEGEEGLTPYTGAGKPALPPHDGSYGDNPQVLVSSGDGYVVANEAKEEELRANSIDAKYEPIEDEEALQEQVQSTDADFEIIDDGLNGRNDYNIVDENGDVTQYADNSPQEIEEGDKQTLATIQPNGSEPSDEIDEDTITEVTAVHPYLYMSPVGANLKTTPETKTEQANSGSELRHYNSPARQPAISSTTLDAGGNSNSRGNKENNGNRVQRPRTANTPSNRPAIGAGVNTPLQNNTNRETVDTTRHLPPTRPQQPNNTDVMIRDGEQLQQPQDNNSGDKRTKKEERIARREARKVAWNETKEDIKELAKEKGPDVLLKTTQILNDAVNIATPIAEMEFNIGERILSAAGNVVENGGRGSMQDATGAVNDVMRGAEGALTGKSAPRAETRGSKPEAPERTNQPALPQEAINTAADNLGIGIGEANDLYERYNKKEENRKILTQLQKELGNNRRNTTTLMIAAMDCLTKKGSGEQALREELKDLKGISEREIQITAAYMDRLIKS